MQETTNSCVGEFFSFVFEILIVLVWTPEDVLHYVFLLKLASSFRSLALLTGGWWWVNSRAHAVGFIHEATVVQMF